MGFKITLVINKSLKSILVCICICIFTLPVSIKSATLKKATKLKTPTWYTFHRPPWYIGRGELKGQGYAEKIQKIWQTLIPDYKHENRLVNFTRLAKELSRHERQYCIAAIAKGPVKNAPGYSGQTYWSKALYLLPNHRIFMSKPMFKKLGSPTSISMKKLINNKKYIWGTISDLNYLPINYSQYINNLNIVIVSNISPLLNLLKMIKHERIDWFADLPMFMTWESKKNKKLLGKIEIVTVEIEETKKLPPVYAYFAARKDKVGRMLVKRVNRSLTKRNILKIRSFVRAWLPDNRSKQVFDRINKKHFGF